MTDITTQIVIALTILVVIWYIAGSWMNRRRASYLLGWIKKGVQELGGEATWRAMGTSGFQVSVRGAKHPFKRIEMVILLEPREVLLFWLFNRLRGHRDMMVLKADLRTIPRAEVEVMPKRAGITKKFLKAIEGKAWAREGIGDTNLMVLRKGKGVTELAEKLAHLLRGYAPHVLRFSLRKRSPHLLIHLSLPGLESAEAKALFGMCKEMVGACQGA